MATLPTREALGPMPAINPNVGIASPDTTAIGRGIANFGQGIQQAGAAINLRDEAMKRAWEQTKLAEANSKLLQFRSDQTNALDEYKRNLDPSQAQGASTRFIQSFDAQAKDMLDSVDPSIRATIGDKAFEYRTAFQSDAQTVEYDGQKTYTTKVISDGTDTLLTSLRRSGGQNYDEVLQQGTDLITGNTALTKVEQFNLVEKWRESAATTWVQAQAATNPVGTLNDLNAHLRTQPPPPPDQFTAVPNPAGQVSPGNIDITSRPIADLGNGEWATVRSMSFNEDGKEILVPTIGPDGKALSNEEAIALYHSTGKHLGIFDNPTDATAYAIALHNQQDVFYRNLLGVADQIATEQKQAGNKDVSSEDIRRQVVAAYTALKAVGFPATNDQVYLADTLGPDAAIAILSSPGQPVTSVLDPQKALASGLSGKTTDQVIADARTKTGMAAADAPPSPLDSLSPDKVDTLIAAVQGQVDKQRTEDDKVAREGRPEIIKTGIDLMNNTVGQPNYDATKPSLTPEWVAANRDNLPPATYDMFLKALTPGGDTTIHTPPKELLRLDALAQSNPTQAIQELQDEFANGIITRGSYDQISGRAQGILNGVEKRPFIAQTRATLAATLGTGGVESDSARFRHLEALVIYDRWARDNPDATAESANAYAAMLNKNEKSFVGAEIGKDLAVPKFSPVTDRRTITSAVLLQAQKATADAFQRGAIDEATAADQARLIQQWNAAYADVGLATVAPVK